MNYKNFWFLAMILIFISCQKEVDTDSVEYQQAVSDFYVSLAASQTDEARFAFNKMNDVTQAFPEEAAAWTNLGVYAMRQGNLNLAFERMERARELMPEQPEVLFLSGMVESRGGNISRAVEYLQKAAAADSTNLRVQYALAMELEREDDEANAVAISEQLQKINHITPDNQVILLELIRTAVKEGDFEVAERYTDRLEEISSTRNSENRAQIKSVREVIQLRDAASVNFELSLLRNGLETQPDFQDDLLQVQLPPTEVGFLLTEFLWLPEPEVMVSAADLGLQFNESAGISENMVQWIKGVTLLEDSPPFPVTIQNGLVMLDEQNHLEYPGEEASQLRPHIFAEIDYNYNFRNDIALAGTDGFKLYRQDENETFTDVTEELGLSREVLTAAYTGVWTFDMDMDGDLDLLLSKQNDSPVVLRNNGDDTFSTLDVFGQLDEIRDFKWADFDSDGVPEAIFLTENGELYVLKNLRGGEFDEPEQLTDKVAALTVTDINADSWFEIITADENGGITIHNRNERTGLWQSQELANSNLEQGQSSLLFAADMDNNGGIDLLLSTESESRIWLADSEQNFRMFDGELPGNIRSLMDINGNERLDLLGINPEQNTVQYVNTGTKEYNARSIRARASGQQGDGRINSFGIGGEMEVRAGLLYQKQVITSPIMHFGLGGYEEADMLRIIWPNGSVQAEFAELGMGSTIFNEQILKGSCPWLFTNDGEEIHFITDILWRSPLGLRINAQETAGVVQTMDRVKIPGSQLKEVDGSYDLRITAELWESHFFDYVSLIAVDHPEDTDIFVDERFAFPAPDLSTRAMGKPEPVAMVRDEQGKDVTQAVSQKDQIYLAPFTHKTKYQGLVKPHSIEIDLADEAPDAPLWLVLSGWLRPTDSSINLAISQGSIQPPKGLKVEVADGGGGWKLLHDNYGFPAGKLKSILLDLDDVFPDPSDRRIRLTTTSEIYWDTIQWAEKMDDSVFQEKTIKPEVLELEYRGYSEWSRVDSVSPSLPNYEEISGTAPRWRDLTGFHTRFGDVSELLEKVDDRYVIMNAGDELVMRFPAPDPPAEGWTRSFVFVSDGWEKDGDYNTGASATVAPLPFHGQADYDYAGSGDLSEDPVYQKHRNDWLEYHTRYITPDAFNKAISF